MTRIAAACPVCAWQGTPCGEGDEEVLVKNPLGRGQISELAGHLIASHYDPDLPGDGQPWHGMFTRYVQVTE